MGVADNALVGKRIILTRAADQSRVLVEELTRRGARVILLPCVEFHAPQDCSPLDAAIARLSEFDWLVFTSQNAVKFFCERARELEKPVLVPLARPRIAAFGAATANAVAAEGLHVEFVGQDARSGTEFVRELAREVRGTNVLLPQSDLATSTVVNGLRESGASVTSVVAYRTCVPESLDIAEWDRVRREGADVFVFASPSAFRNFAQIAGEADLRRFSAESTFAAIGPTTAEAIRAAGFRIEIEAQKATPEDIIAAMNDYFLRTDAARVSR